MNPSLDYERLYRDVSPSVVSVYVGRDGPSVGAGSGFVYALPDSATTPDASASTPRTPRDRYVVTNRHVVGPTTEVELRFADGQWRTGTVVGTDVYTDLAVVAVADLPPSATPLSVAASNPKPGRQVAALGNPMGLDGSITAGIVSGANRSMPTSNGFAIPDVVQTDAPINPGNSGGPLVGVEDDADGEIRYEVVGVNRARQGDNIGFAISPEIVNRVVPALVTDGRYRHSYLRTRTLDVTPTVAEANELDDPRGVLVVETATATGGDSLRGSEYVRRVRGREIPAGGDVIVGINGRPLRSHEELMRYLITETRPGEPVAVDVVRNGEPATLSLTLAERPDPDHDRHDGRDGGSRIPIQ